MQKIWRLHNSSKVINTLEELQTLLLQQRGLTADNQETFLNPTYERDVHNPQLLHGMMEAVDRIYKAIANRERILVYGDYDVDGVSSVATMAVVLRDIGANSIPYLPHREDDGYGLNRTVLEGLLNEFDVLITVDCGISNASEIAWLREQKKDVIIVDHHIPPPALPEALAIIHPMHPSGEYPWPHLSGSGVAWKLAQALLRDNRSPHAHDPDKEKWLLDLTLLGTVGDVMPLLNENRAIVRFGLEVLKRTRRPGLRAMLAAARVSQSSINVESVAFRLAPLINAAGRMDHPQPALDTLLAADEVRGAKSAAHLLSLNQQRQSLTRRIAREAQAQINPALPIIVAANTAWPAGVVGLVAGQLAQKMSKPAIVIGGNGRHAVGSARTSGDINILEILRQVEEYTLKLGGHAGAAGFSVDFAHVAAFSQAVHQSTQENALPHLSTHDEEADAVLDPRLIDWNTYELIEQFEPFGEANRRPVFVLKDVSLFDIRPVGKEGKHLKFRFALDEKEVDGIGFGLGEEYKNDDFGTHVDVIAGLDINSFRGNHTLQLQVKDIAKAGTVKIKSEVRDKVSAASHE